MSPTRPGQRSTTAVRSALAGALCASVLLIVPVASGESERADDNSAVAARAKGKPADAVLRNGFIYTVDKRNSTADAIAIRDGKIVYVGSDEGAGRYVGPKTKVTNLKGRMVMPGLHEGHIHEVMDSNVKTCDLAAQPLSVPELQAKLQACLDDPELHTAAPGDPHDFLVVTNLYMQFLKPTGTTPHRSMLDALPTDRPIVISAAVTGHTTLVNSKALQLAGIDRNTPNPEGGRIDHDPDGEPNGLLQDTAPDPVYALVPPPPPISPKEEVALAKSRMKDFAREGITTFFVPGVAEDEVKVFHRLSAKGGLTARAQFAILAEISDPVTGKSRRKFVERILDIRRKIEGKEKLPRAIKAWRPGKARGPRLVARPGVSVPSAKLFLDGIAQFPGQTAAMTEPYLGPDGQPLTGPSAKGELYVDNSTLDPTVTMLEAAGIQSHIHAIGDQAVRVALDAFAAARKANGDMGSHQTIAHAEVVHPDDYKRFGKLDVTASMGLQWAKPAPDSTDAVKPYLGPRWDLYEPTVPITRGGGRVSLGSDCCLDPFDEWFDLEVAILREADWGPEFPQYEGKLNALPGLSLAQGIRTVTIHGAYQMHQQKVTGSLEVGKLADLVVLNQNLTEIPLDDISNTDVLMTMVGGKRVWVDPAF